VSTASSYGLVCLDAPPHVCFLSHDLGEIISHHPPSHPVTLAFGRKAGTAVATAWTAFYGLFYIDYGSHEHCFTNIQRWYRNKLDGLLGIDAQAAKQISYQRENNTDDCGFRKEEGISKGNISR
jgi:hypothetical protein